MVAAYTEQVHGLVTGGVDILLAETSFDTLNLKACLFAIDQYFEETDRRLPVMVSGTIFENGRTLSAQTVEAFWISVSHFDMLSVGINCAVGVDQMRPQDRELCRRSRSCRISCYPNAGLPDGFGGFDGDTRAHGAGRSASSPRNGWLNIVGGCCGTTPERIHAIAEAVEECRTAASPELPALVVLQRHRSRWSSGPNRTSSWSASAPTSPARADSPG